MSEKNVDKVSWANRRRYPRVSFEQPPRELDVSIEGYGATLVYDMSFAGAALTRPSTSLGLDEGAPVTVVLKTDEGDSIKISGKIARCTPEVLAIQFIEVLPEARILIDQLISSRMIGLNMQLIDKKHYSPSATFQYWFHGPKETNLFLWLKVDSSEEGGTEELLKAQFDMNSVSLIFDDGHFLYENKMENQWTGEDSVPPREILIKSNEILSQMDTNLHPLIELKSLIANQI